MRSHAPHAFLVVGKRDAGCDAPAKVHLKTGEQV